MSGGLSRRADGLGRGRRIDGFAARLARGASALLFVWIAIVASAPTAFAQTSATGALAGTVTDGSGAMLPGADVTVTNEATGESRSVVTDRSGTYVIPLLPPGDYRVQVTLQGFKTFVRPAVKVNVAERAAADARLDLGDLKEEVTVTAGASIVQLETSVQGRVVSEETVKNLPLVTRNYTQIITLSTGMVSDVTNAGELGRGGGGRVISNVHVQGSRAYDHNFQMDGVEVNDFESSSGGNTAGVAIPNPDTIQEFKVQTGQYDATFGRNAGANVNVITKSGSNQIRGTMFEFFRNEKLNANDYFFKQAGQKKPILRQNQYGGTLGAPLVRDRLLVFTSYQGTGQRNGLAAGQTRAKCAATIFSPPLTDDRSAAALGRLFGGMAGQLGGVAVAPDGSNINPVALALLQAKTPDGQYLLPTPQVIDRSQPFNNQGFTATSNPCTFDEDQGMLNFDYVQSAKSKFTTRTFGARSHQSVPFPTGASNIAAPLQVGNTFVNFSTAHNYVFNSRLFNELRFGYYQNNLTLHHNPAFKYSDFGIRGATDAFNDLPTLTITGAYNIGTCCPLDLPQYTAQLQDHLSAVAGKHTLRFGGGLNYIHTDVHEWRSAATLTFLTFPDFLLGMDGAANGSGFSNVFTSGWSVGPGLDAEYRMTDGFLYAQDDFRLSPRLTLNLGLRYERIGPTSNDLGMNTNLNTQLLNPNPPAAGTLEGWIVPSNFAGGNDVPAGVQRLDNGYGINGNGINNLAPRVGFAWQPLPRSSRLAVRGGWGIYYTRPVGQSIYNTLSAGPFRVNQSASGVDNATATLQNPFGSSVPESFPVWTPLVYSPTTARTTAALDMDFRPPRVQHYSLNTQIEIAHGLLAEIGYIGSRGDHLIRTRSINQAALASPSNPIRGITTNTVANVRQRVPYLGWQANGIRVVESEGESWYDGMAASLTKRFSHGLQFLTSYTLSRALDTDAYDTFNAHTPGLARGDQNDPLQRKGRTDFDRTHRLVISYFYELPTIKRGGVAAALANGWSVGGVTTVQSGRALTPIATAANNVFGINADRAQIAPGCSNEDLVTSGSVADKLNNYFNRSCFTSLPIVGDDGRATGFGNAGVGIVNGPHQQNFDLAIAKRQRVGLFRHDTNVDLRLEIFNVLNTVQFADPITDVISPAFGRISATSVAPRMMQLAVKFNF
jgi:hypothetical protein